MEIEYIYMLSEFININTEFELKILESIEFVTSIMVPYFLDGIFRSNRARHDNMSWEKVKSCLVYFICMCEKNYLQELDLQTINWR